MDGNAAAVVVSGQTTGDYMTDAATSAFSIDRLNAADAGAANVLMEDIFERSPWLARRAVAARPFAGPDALAAWIEAEVLGLPQNEALRLLRAHPELAPPRPETMTAASQAEQGQLGLTMPATEAADRLARLNRAYAERHGFPFVIALHAQAHLGAVLAQFESRLANETEAELARALGEVVSVMKARLARLTFAAAAGTPPRPASIPDPAEGRAAP